MTPLVREYLRNRFLWNMESLDSRLCLDRKIPQKVSRVLDALRDQMTQEEQEYLDYYDSLLED